MEFDDFDDIETSPILYYDVISSQARSCQMLIQILKINVHLQSTDSLDDIDLSETYTWINSFCKLPTLVDGGITLCNGHSILIYLCQKYASKNSANLCPCDYITRQKITSMLFYEGCVLHRCLSHLMTDIILAKYPNFNVEYHKRKVSNVYSSLNTFLNGHLFMIGNYLTIADISIVSSVSALSVIFPIDHNKFPKLFDWFERLKKMEFYNCNDEGILKLRYMLRNIGKFPFPSPFAIETKRNSNRSERTNKSGDQKSKTKRIDNLSQTDENERTERMEKASGLSTGSKNDKAMEESETFHFYDTFFINVPCNCSHADSNTREKQDSIETSEIGESPETVVHSTSTGNTLKDPRHHNISLYPSNETNEGLEQLVGPCSCRKELCKINERELAKRRLKRSEKFNRESPKRSNNNEREIDWRSVEPKENDISTTSGSEDTNYDYLKQHRAVKQKYSKTCECNGKQSKKIVKDKHNEDILTEPDKKISNDAAVSAQSTEQMKSDFGQNNKNNRLRNQEVEDLVAKVNKLETILETSDKVLRNSNQIPTTVSDNSSTDSITKRFPRICGSPSGSFQPKPHLCNCHNKPKISDQICQRGTRIDALDFDEVTNVVMPKFLVRNLEIPECSNKSENNKDETKNSDRLEAGSNRNQCKSKLIVNNYPTACAKLRNINEDSENITAYDDEKSATIVYLVCAKNICKNKIKCHSDDCCKKEKVISSKIPRLIPPFPSWINVQEYKISKLTSRKIGCNFLNVGSL